MNIEMNTKTKISVGGEVRDVYSRRYFKWICWLFIALLSLCVPYSYFEINIVREILLVIMAILGTSISALLVIVIGRRVVRG